MADTVAMFAVVALGGAIGAMMRFAVYRTVDTEFPWATFIVNVVGCMLASYLMFRYGFDMADTTKTFLFVGIFGAFTTMSTFSIDTINLMADQQWVPAIGNIALNSVICVGGAALGRLLALSIRPWLADVRVGEIHHPGQILDPDLDLVPHLARAEVDALLRLGG